MIYVNRYRHNVCLEPHLCQNLALLNFCCLWSILFVYKSPCFKKNCFSWLNRFFRKVTTTTNFSRLILLLWTNPTVRAHLENSSRETMACMNLKGPILQYIMFDTIYWYKPIMWAKMMESMKYVRVCHSVGVSCNMN